MHTIVKMKLSPTDAGKLYCKYIDLKDENKALRKQLKELYDAVNLLIQDNTIADFDRVIRVFESIDAYKLEER